MRAVVQRVLQAEVTVDERVVGAVGEGYLVYAAVAKDDGPEDVQYIAEKILGLRIFNDDAGKMNRSIVDVGGGLLVISAFALQGDVRKGRRPSFDLAAGPELGEQLYNQLCELLAASGLTVARGLFRQHMHVSSTNDGPISILLDSKRTF
jgi:D-tyrosyl-tRNA(Tyr) deacylase